MGTPGWHGLRNPSNQSKLKSDDKSAANVADGETKGKVGELHCGGTVSSADLRPVFEQLLAEYQFACLRHHGRALVSPKVIAELVKMGWTSPPKRGD